MSENGSDIDANDGVTVRLLPVTSATKVARNATVGSSDPQAIELHLFAQKSIYLSDIVPVLENFGFRVFGQKPLIVGSEGTAVAHCFQLALENVSQAALVSSNLNAIETVLANTVAGRAENDRFNALTVSATLDARAVLLFRALFRYLRQTGMAYGLLTVVDALRRHPVVARLLVALFSALHDPAECSELSVSDIRRRIDKALQGVTAIDEDRILRQMRAVILATLRTTLFLPSGNEAVAFKFDSALVPGLPAPVPWREVFVYSPRVEGIHLRAGPIARGGLRWSDRRDDFRTEILSLMKAQRVKNAMIVPTGAKGGFYPKLLPDPSDRDAWLAEGTACYRIYIRALLAITDNLVKGQVVHPQGMICIDGGDPYFVVAADKGTASFSDIANGLALDQAFWLGDAFASGGSVGYDHNAMGITARGAWISVKRHFAEAGIDIQKEPIRVAGCGDMSGDVFGNAMLLSKAIKLVAAFDHRHIFLDPDPDPAKSWRERRRLFKLPRSSWDDYDQALISRGGGIFPRAAKSIKLNKELQKLLGTDARELDPAALIAAILESPVDLLWFGGIGTYVKARSENQADAGDRGNDANRVAAEDLRCAVVGEGANLGVTQAARIAFALNGGRINTDFIDNSAGVDCSDNEVNIKIALDSVVAAGHMTQAARNQLLGRMTEDVAALVLEDNRQQTLALSIAGRDGARDTPAHIRVMEGLERTGLLDRPVEALPANDVLIRRVADGYGLTRPELAVLLATAKLAFQDGIKHTGLGTDPATLPDLIAAFPAEMQVKHRAAIEAHPLRSEIIATKLANRIVNRMGIVHPFELAEEENALLGTVSEAFVIAEQVYDIPKLWHAIDNADVTEECRLMLFEQVAIELRAHMADILRHAIETRTNDKAITAYRPTVALLSAKREALLPSEAIRQTRAYGVRLTHAGTPKRIVDQLVRLAQLDGAIGLSAVADLTKADVVALTKAFTALGVALGIDWAQGAAMQLDPIDPWERLLAAGVSRDFQTMRLDFLRQKSPKQPVEAVAMWVEKNRSRIDPFRALINRANSGAMPSPAMLAQIAGQARALLTRT
jgi:glutamate dehydrogenase